MAALVRPATGDDVPALLALRADLTPRWREPFITTAGGFVLGSTEETYRAHVANGCAWVAETRGLVEAYSVVLPDAVLRTTEVYAKRHQADVPPGLVERLEGARVAYFDQLAARPGYGATATGLAYLHLLDACTTHDAVLATTVIDPVVNRAAVPLLEAVGFTAVGSIAEHYPDVGPITSRVYLVETHAVLAAARSPRGLRFERRAIRGMQAAACTPAPSTPVVPSGA